MSTYVDAGGAAKEWVNSLTATLVGPGKPLPLGASLKQRDGAASVPYGYIIELPAGMWGGTEHPSMAGRISMQIYGPTKESASDAAIAYAEALLSLEAGIRASLSGGVTIIGAQDIQGPGWFPDGDEPRYIVDSTLLFA